MNKETGKQGSVFLVLSEEPQKCHQPPLKKKKKKKKGKKEMGPLKGTYLQKRS